MIKAVAFKNVEWYGMLGKETDEIFLPMSNYFLKEYGVLEISPV